MRVTGIIAEYNPLHLGHQFHIAQTRELIKSNASTHADEPHYVITVLSGDFVQRGLPALLDKHTRTCMALEAGSDLVLELPVPYALSSGEGFAFGGVSLLNQLGCVDTLSFGSEAGELGEILKIAHFINDMDTAADQSLTVTYHAAYQAALKQGLTPPSARLKALQQVYPDMDTCVLDAKSNNMLALEYCKALLQLKSSIEPFTIKRQGQDYLEHTLSSDGQTSFPSATAIRESLKSLDSCSKEQLSGDVFDFGVPTHVKDVLLQYHAENRLIYADDFSSMLHYKLLNLTKEDLEGYFEISSDFANKIMKNLKQYENFTQFSNLLWTKDTTYARVCRNLMNIILDIKKNTWDVHQPVPYARVLGFRKGSAELLSEIKQKSAIPLITKLADAETLLPQDAYRLLELDMKTAHIYDSVILQKSGQKAMHEMQKQLLIL